MQPNAVAAPTATEKATGMDCCSWSTHSSLNEGTALADSRSTVGQDRCHLGSRVLLHKGRLAHRRPEGHIP
jgi:hypothetical protein